MLVTLARNENTAVFVSFRLIQTLQERGNTFWFLPGLRACTLHITQAEPFPPLVPNNCVIGQKLSVHLVVGGKWKHSRQLWRTFHVKHPKTRKWATVSGKKSPNVVYKGEHLSLKMVILLQQICKGRLDLWGLCRSCAGVWINLYMLDFHRVLQEWNRANATSLKIIRNSSLGPQPSSQGSTLSGSKEYQILHNLFKIDLHFTSWLGWNTKMNVRFWLLLLFHQKIKVFSHRDQRSDVFLSVISRKFLIPF